MKGEICMVIAIVLLVLSLVNSSVVMAETLKYIPFPQEISAEFYYTDICIFSSQRDLDEISESLSEYLCGIMPIYGEGANFYTDSMIWVLELSSAEDAKEVYSCHNKFMQGEVKGEGVHIVGINTFGDESISYYHPEGYSSTLFINGRFVVFIEARFIKNSEEESIIRYTLPKLIDTKLEQIKVPTPTPTPSISAFQIITAIATLLAVAYLIIRRRRY